MSDPSSALKICPHCGQAVPFSSFQCPSCGMEFAADEAEFVGFENVQPAAAAGAAAMGGAMGDYPEDTVYVGEAGAAAYTAQGAGSGAAGGTSYGGAAAAGAAGGFAARTMAEAAAGKGAKDPYASGRAGTRKPGSGNHGTSGKKPDPDQDEEKSKSGLIITIVAAVLLLIVIGTGIGMAFKLGIMGSKDSNDTVMEEAQTQMDEGNYTAAIVKLEALISSGNATVETYELLAEAYEKNGDADGAAKAYLRGYQNLEDSSLRRSAINSYLKLGDAAKDNQQYDKARTYYQTVLDSLDSSNSQATAGLQDIEDLLAEGTLQTDTEEEAEVSPSSSATIMPPSQTSEATPSASASADASKVSEGDQVVVTPTPTPTATPAAKTTTVPAATTPKTTATATATPTAKSTQQHSDGTNTEPNDETNTEPNDGTNTEPSDGTITEPSDGTNTEPSDGTNTEPNEETDPEPSVEPSCDFTATVGGRSCQGYLSADSWDACNAASGGLVSISSESDFSDLCSAADTQGLIFVWIGGSSISDHDGGGDGSCPALVKEGDTWYIEYVSGDAASSYSGKSGYIAG